MARPKKSDNLETKSVQMEAKSWKKLDKLAGKLSRGKYISRLLDTELAQAVNQGQRYLAVIKKMGAFIVEIHKENKSLKAEIKRLQQITTVTPAKTEKKEVNLSKMAEGLKDLAKKQ